MTNKRFSIRNEVNRVTGKTSIIVDQATGVNYLWHTEGFGGGLTILVDQNGQPIITPTAASPSSTRP